MDSCSADRNPLPTAMERPGVRDVAVQTWDQCEKHDTNFVAITPTATANQRVTEFVENLRRSERHDNPDQIPRPPPKKNCIRGNLCTNVLNSTTTNVAAMNVNNPIINTHQNEKIQPTPGWRQATRTSLCLIVYLTDATTRSSSFSNRCECPGVEPNHAVIRCTHLCVLASYPVQLTSLTRKGSR